MCAGIQIQRLGRNTAAKQKCTAKNSPRRSYQRVLSVKTPEDKTAPEKEHQKKQEVSASEKEKLSHVEMEIGRLEATVKMYTAQMSMNPDNYADLAAEYDEAQKKLEALYEKWDELAAKMD